MIELFSNLMCFQVKSKSSLSCQNSRLCCEEEIDVEMMFSSVLPVPVKFIEHSISRSLRKEMTANNEKYLDNILHLVKEGGEESNPNTKLTMVLEKMKLLLN
jgi:hypothetical protein